MCNFKNYSDNYSEWIENLFEIGGDKYAYQTIEYALGQNYHLKELWKAYILTLKTRNSKVNQSSKNRYSCCFSDYAAYI